MELDNEKIVTVDQEIVPIADDTMIAVARRAEERIAAVNKIKKLALKVTNKHDWTDQGGKPYLQVSGAEKVARLFGISWRIDEPQLLTDGDGHFTYSYKGEFSIPGAKIEATGERSSRDTFFSTRYKYEEGQKVKFELPPSEIDRGNVKKAAFTNCIGSGITRLLGIRNLTYEDLKESGIDLAQIAKVDYGKKQDTGDKISEAQGKRLYAIMTECKIPSTLVKDYLKEQYGIESHNDILKVNYDQVIQWIQANKK